ncbi:MAG: M23 family metallopeptidase [Bacteroidales bacterium]|jgi:murein DD-endopeptidase MepM/ murein hydrolase activator NlpD|nr:M23 family metallopeptidase [Bacteroidales bacterium]
MAKGKYKYNPELLSYDRVKSSIKNTIVKIFTYVTASVAIIILAYLIFSPFFDTPRERILGRELRQMTSNYEILNQKMDQLEIVLSDLQQRDDNIYRKVFEAEPIPQSVRQAGIGGIERYEAFEDYSTTDLMKEVNQRIDKIFRQVQIQERSYNELLKMTQEQSENLVTRPSIQPIENKDLERTASGFGEKIHPIFGTKFFHKGIDFTAPIGTPVFATAGGTVLEKGLFPGFGNKIVIDHGNGCQTLYAHLNELNVTGGQHVKKGQKIGTVGNTGISISPHLHYEVHKHGKPVNPINYFLSNLNAAEYALMLDLTNVGKTFD